MFKEYTVNCQQGDIAVVEMGAPDGIPVIALHGWLDNAASFKPLSAHLSKIRLIALDMAGHGHSYHRSYPYNYNLWDDFVDILDVADALQLEQVRLLGHSRGGIISAMLCAVSDRIERVALLDSFFFVASKDEEAADLLGKYLARRRRKASPKTVYRSLEQMAEIRQKSHLTISLEAARLLVERGAEKSDEGYVWTSDSALRSSSAIHFNEPKIRSVIAKIQCPMKIWLREEFARSLELVDALIENNPQAVLQRWQGDHHFHMETNVKQLAEELETFLL